ncbi:MAG: hypothetical protein KF768_11920 [Phycisphaeraceae bacterium]|nr:hypothetical protein [Phycisphaeraceae bacterium]
MAQEDNAPKIGAGHASAMFRQGLAELRGALYPESNVAQPTVYGIYGTKTPGEVMQEKQGEQRDPDETPSILDERVKQAESQMNRELEPPQQERE